MAIGGGTRAALVRVAAASVTQLIQFGGSFIWFRDALEALKCIPATP